MLAFLVMLLLEDLCHFTFFFLNLLLDEVFIKLLLFRFLVLLIFSQLLLGRLLDFNQLDRFSSSRIGHFLDLFEWGLLLLSCADLALDGSSLGWGLRYLFWLGLLLVLAASPLLLGGCNFLSRVSTHR